MSYLIRWGFWKGAIERSIKTFLQAFLATLIAYPVGVVVGVDISKLNWLNAVWLGFGAAILSLLSSIVSGPIGPGNTPSLVTTDGSGKNA